MLFCVRGLQHHRVIGLMLSLFCQRFTALSCLGVHFVLQHHRVTDFMLFLLCQRFTASSCSCNVSIADTADIFFITALIIADDQLFCVRVVSIDNTN